MSGEVFNLYLHQNYLDFFSEVDDVAQASTYLSDADLLAAYWMVSLLWLLRSSGVGNDLACSATVGFRSW